MTRAVTRVLALLLMGGALAVTGCVDDRDDSPASGEVEPTGTTGSPEATSPSGTTIHVPSDHPTIQRAVDAAQPGDLILVEPGVYAESVEIRTPGLTVRGADRNEVVLDGGFTLPNGILVAGANGVALENITARNYTGNGFIWTGAVGFRAAYLTAYRMGSYGIYVFDSSVGVIEQSYASGSPEGGFYVGQCYPCDTVVDHVLSEHNGLGYTGTNAGGGLAIVNSTFRYNRVGLMPNSGTYELCYPQRETAIVGNVVHSNNQPDTPATRSALRNMGTGILVYGGTDNLIARNVVDDHERIGIALLSRLEEEPDDDAGSLDDDRACSEARQDPPVDASELPDSLEWMPQDNHVIGNVITGSGVADLALATFASDGSGLRNCFADNQFASSAPARLETLAPCDEAGSGDWSANALDLAALLAGDRPPATDYKTSPVPPPQPTMPDARSAPARTTDRPPVVDLDVIRVPPKR